MQSVRSCSGRAHRQRLLTSVCPRVGTMQFVQEILASHLAGVPARHVPKDRPLYEHALARAKIGTKAVKMALYGVFVSAPMGHYLVGLLQRAFAGRTTTKDKILQILANNFLVSPVQISGACGCVYGERDERD